MVRHARAWSRSVGVAVVGCTLTACSTGPDRQPEATVMAGAAHDAGGTGSPAVGGAWSGSTPGAATAGVGGEPVLAAGGAAGQATEGGGGSGGGAGAPAVPASDGTPVVYVGAGFYSMPSAVHAFAFDPQTGQLSPVQQEIATPVAPTALAVDPTRRRLYATIENVPGQVMALAIEPGTGKLTTLNSRSSGGDGSTHLSLDQTGSWIFQANYESGSVTVLSTASDGKVDQLIDTEVFGENSYAHAVRVDRSNRFVFAPTKGMDAVAQLVFDADTGKLTPNSPPSVASEPGSRPRHLEIHPSKPWAYVVNEAGSSMSAYAIDPALGTLTRFQDLSTLPAGVTVKNTGADVVAHPTGMFLYGSNRGHDSIVIYAIDQQSGRLSLIGHQPSGGSTPQSVTVDASGRFLVVTNKGSDRVSFFEIDPDTGTLTPFGSGISVDTPSWAGLIYVPP